MQKSTRIFQGNTIQTARFKRLSEGRCPIHGIGMPQSNNTDYKNCNACGVGWPLNNYVECPRRDCNIIAVHSPSSNELKLPENLQYVLEGNSA